MHVNITTIITVSSIFERGEPRKETGKLSQKIQEFLAKRMRTKEQIQLVEWRKLILRSKVSYIRTYNIATIEGTLKKGGCSKATKQKLATAKYGMYALKGENKHHYGTHERGYESSGKILWRVV